jgi:hypothetical protein
MRVNVRREPRRKATGIYSVCWQEPGGLTASAQVEGVDISDSGIGFQSSVELAPGLAVFIQGQDGHPKGYGVVRNCAAREGGFLIGLEYNEETKKTVKPPDSGVIDYYELLQLSPNAEAEAIHRAYRYLAARYHPDNPKTGDPEKFLLVQSAFNTLVDPKRRAEYDLAQHGAAVPSSPMSDSIDFMDGIQGDVNRRLALLSLLYRKRRISPDAPEVSLAEAEAQMGFPREYLNFTIWYLKSKKYITKGDNSDLALTAPGVDYVESNCSKTPIFHKLLGSGSGAATGSEDATGREDLISPEVLLPNPEEDSAG